jgi:hypothetical protein
MSILKHNSVPVSVAQRLHKLHQRETGGELYPQRAAAQSVSRRAWNSKKRQMRLEPLARWTAIPPSSQSIRPMCTGWFIIIKTISLFMVFYGNTKKWIYADNLFIQLFPGKGDWFALVFAPFVQNVFKKPFLHPQQIFFRNLLNYTKAYSDPFKNMYSINAKLKICAMTSNFFYCGI